MRVREAHGRARAAHTPRATSGCPVGWSHRTTATRCPEAQSGKARSVWPRALLSPGEATRLWLRCQHWRGCLPGVSVKRPFWVTTWWGCRQPSETVGSNLSALSRRLGAQTSESTWCRAGPAWEPPPRTAAFPHLHPRRDEGPADPAPWQLQEDTCSFTLGHEDRRADARASGKDRSSARHLGGPRTSGHLPVEQHPKAPHGEVSPSTLGHSLPRPQKAAEKVPGAGGPATQ